MASFENTVTIRRPVEDVFAFLADFENVPKWNDAIVETTKVSPGPVGVGTTYRQTRSAPSRSDEAFEVTVFEPASRLEVQGGLGLFTARVSYLLEPAGSGTRLTNAVDLGSSGLLTLVAPLATSRVKHAVAANLDTLKQLLEGGGRPGVGLRRSFLGTHRTGWLCHSPASEAMPSTNRPSVTPHTPGSPRGLRFNVAPTWYRGA
jgi:carbon monoxide dehydrogenase subunit G